MNKKLTCFFSKAVIPVIFCKSTIKSSLELKSYLCHLSLSNSSSSLSFLFFFFFLIWRTYILPPTEGIIAFSGFDYYSQDIGLWPRVYQSNTWAKTWSEQLVTQTSGTLIALSLAETKFLGNLVPGKQWLAVMLCFLQFFYFPQLTCLLYVLDQCHS